MPYHRPENVDYPKIWLKFVSDKTNQSFVVKDLTPEYHDLALGYMTNMFLKESAICGPLRVLEDPVGRSRIQKKWLDIMKRNLAIICVTEDNELPRVAGIHLTMLREKNALHKKDTSAEDKFSSFSKVVEDLKDEGQLFEKFGADLYLGSLGLFVLPEFRGQGIAKHLLKARIAMCEALGLCGTASVFSTKGAQAAALAAGYKHVASKMFEGQNLAVMAASVQNGAVSTKWPQAINQ